MSPRLKRMLAVNEESGEETRDHFTRLPTSVTRRKQESTGQTDIPVRNFKESTKEWTAAGGVQVIYAKRIKRITLQRVLCSKIVFDLKSFKNSELLVLYDNILILQDMCRRDQGFNKKFGQALEVLAEILKKSNLVNAPTKTGLKNLSDKIKENLEAFLIPKRNYEHTWKYFSGKFEIRMGKKLGTPNDKLTPKRYIGIGYRDKGTARDLALNGEPSWQEYCKMRLWDNLT